MKNFILLFVFMLALAVHAQAQNKTFSIGPTSPNLNAALHVESPTNNQGVICQGSLPPSERLCPLTQQILACSFMTLT